MLQAPASSTRTGRQESRQVSAIHQSASTEVRFGFGGVPLREELVLPYFW